jgi:hypothetical protein
MVFLLEKWRSNIWQYSAGSGFQFRCYLVDVDQLSVCASIFAVTRNRGKFHARFGDHVHALSIPPRYANKDLKMKKIASALLAVALVAGVTAPTFAQATTHGCTFKEASFCEAKSIPNTDK